MKPRYALIALALAWGTLPASAQRNVPPSTIGNQATYLNRVIAADGGATGPRTQTEYALQSGGTYFVDGVIENTGWDLTVRSADGATARPRIIPLAGDGGTTLANVFTVRGNLVLRGVYVTGQDDSGAFLDRIIRAQVTDVQIRIEDSWLDYSGQSAIRVDNNGGRLYMRRSIVSNHGRMNSVDNGRAIDMRGTTVADIDVVDNVFYNITSRAYRSGGGTAQRVRMEHNTFVNIGQRTVEVGRVMDFTYQNNLAVNPGFLGVSGEVTPTTTPNVEFLNPASGTPTVTIRNDNAFTDPAVVSALQSAGHVPRPTFNGDALPYIEAAGTGPTLTAQAVTFQSAPPTQRVVDAVLAERDTDPATFSNLETRARGTAQPVTWDFRYATTSPLYTAGTDGQPLGALFLYGLAVSAEGGLEAASGLRAFPNPSSSRATVAFALAASADVRLAVYDVLGREVAVVGAGPLGAGPHVLAVDVASLPAGAYVARLLVDGRAEAVRLTVVR